MSFHKSLAGAATFVALASALTAQTPLDVANATNGEACMMRGINWRTEALFTIGNSVGNFVPTGIPDGMGAIPSATNPGAVTLFVNSELNPGNGYPYTLANGTSLTGARVIKYEVVRDANGASVLSAGLAYDTIIDRQGNVVTTSDQVNETGNSIDGFARFCSGGIVLAGQGSFVEDIYFCGEETSKPFHPHEGSVVAIDVDTEIAYAVPALGRGAWENLTYVETGDPQTVGVFHASDKAGSPMHLWVGTKNAVGDNSFLDRNGLVVGTLYAWKADNGDATPDQFNTSGNSRSGDWFPITTFDAALAGTAGYDAFGWQDGDTLYNQAVAQGAFQFSRPEDVATNPVNGQQVAFASTGRGSLFPSDNWGTIYVVDFDFTGSNPRSTFTILTDADFDAVPDDGVRSPDNLVWANDGFIYAQEDRSTSPSSLFGGTSGRDSSIWQIDPANGAIVRIAEMNRTVVLPDGSTDRSGALVQFGNPQLGNWENSGIIDVTDLFPTQPGEVLLLANVQAHGVRDGLIGDNPLLDEGGQLFFITNQGVDHAVESFGVDVNNDGVQDGADVIVSVTNGTPNGIYAVVPSFSNPGVAPNGWFYGIDASLFDFGITTGTPGFIGTLDAAGNAAFNIPVPGASNPIGFSLDAVVVELTSATGVPTVGSKATQHKL